MNPDFKKLFEELNNAMRLVESFDSRLAALEGNKTQLETNTQSKTNTSTRSGFDDEGVWRTRLPLAAKTSSRFWPDEDDTKFCPKIVNDKPKKRIAVIIGHNAIVKGAYSETLGLHEYDFNISVAKSLRAFPPPNVSIDLFNRAFNTSRQSIREDVMMKHQETPFDAIIEMHFNSFGSENAKGGECLISNITTKRNKELGKIFYDKLIDVMNIRPRGLKEISKGDRGFSNIDDFRVSFGFEGPVLIAEPFFGSNPLDCMLAEENAVNAYYEAIKILTENL